MTAPEPGDHYGRDDVVAAGLNVDDVPDPVVASVTYSPDGVHWSATIGTAYAPAMIVARGYVDPPEPPADRQRA